MMIRKRAQYLLAALLVAALAMNLLFLSAPGNVAQAVEAKLCVGKYIDCLDGTRGLECVEVDEVKNGDFNCVLCPWNTCDPI